MIAITLALLGGPLMPHCHHEHVDMIEVNHVHDKKGDHIFSQVVLWKIDALDGKLHNWGWKMIKQPWDQPISYDGIWNIYHICDRGTLDVSAPCYRERSTMHDVEREDSRDWWKNEAPNLFNLEKVKVGDE